LTTSPGLDSLSALCGLRTAPTLDAPQRQRLSEELATRLAGCAWFTIGVMAPSTTAAVKALASCQQALGWSPLVADGAVPAAGPVFLKGNQATGLYRLRSESGLGEGLLITGHQPDDSAAEGTWGPFPIDFFG